MKPERKIRRIQEADFEAIYPIYSYYVENSSAILDLVPENKSSFFARLKKLGQEPFYGAFVDGKLIGYGYVHPAFEKEGYKGVQEVTIYFEEGNHFGLAKEMMEKLIGDCRGRKDRILVSCITADNQRSVDFHDRFGFKKTGFLPKAGKKFGQLYDVCWMCLDLQD